MSRETPKPEIPKKPTFNFRDEVSAIAQRLILEGHPCGKELLGALNYHEEKFKQMPAGKICAFMDHMMKECEFNDKVKAMDNRELVWRYYQTDFPEKLPLFGPEAALHDEIMNRLVPDWDGENVEQTETGWKTPNGEINYL